MPGRTFASADRYRYGFNNQEKDDEVKGNGNQVEFKYRGYDTRLGRFFAVDPLASDYPWNSPFAFAENKPIETIDLEGAESSWDHHAARMYSTSEGALKMNNAHKENKKVILIAAATGGGMGAVYIWGTRAVAFYLLEEAAEEIVGHPIIPDPVDAVQSAIRKQYSSAPIPSTKHFDKTVGGTYKIEPSMAFKQKRAIREAYAEKVFKQSGVDQTDVNINKLMKSMDFSKPVKETVLKEGSVIYRWEKSDLADNAEKHFFTNETGINSPHDVGFMGAKAGEYQLKGYQVTKTTTVMESTVSGSGTTQQYFSTDLQNNLKPL